MKIRELQPDDRNAILTLCDKRAYPRSQFATVDRMKRIVAEHLNLYFDASERPPELTSRILEVNGEIRGFMTVEANEVESITRQPQTVVCDYHAETAEQFAALMEWATEFAKSFDDDYLVLSHFEDFDDRKPWLEQCGFRPELVRVARTIGPDHQAFEDPDFRVRRANHSEMLFILRLVSSHSPLYRPAHRDVDVELIQQGFLNVYSNITPRSKERVPLVLEEKESGEVVGYIIVQPGRVLGRNGALTLYIYDIAVDPDFPRRGMSRHLCAGGEKLLARMGGGVFYGDISADNKLALGAQKGLGFAVDSMRWGLPL